MTSLELNNISKAYGTALAVTDMNLTVETGEFVSLLGPSGCGKTTTLRMIAGFVEPTTGTIVINGRDVTRLAAFERNTGLVFQSYALFPHMSVAQNVAFGLEMRKIPRPERDARTVEALQRVRLDHLADRYPRQLSGGQQQRVALARALILNPDIFLLDEPLSNLDAKLRGEVRSEIRALQQSLELTTLMVTHDQEEALTMSDRLVVMEAGAIRQSGTARDLYDRPEDPFVANFVGRSNVIAGRIEDGRFYSKSGDVLPCVADQAPAGDVHFALRPERISLSVDGEGLEAEITEILYLGPQTEYSARVGQTELTVISPTPGPDDALFAVRVGSAVRLRWDQNFVRLFH